MFGHKRIPSREGGVEIVVEELCTRLVRDGHTVVCYNRAGHHVSGAEYDAKIKNEYKGIKLKTVPTIEKKGLAAVSSSFFAALCCAFGRYDVVHIHAEGPAFFAWLPKLFGKKVVVTIHGIDWQREKWKNGFGSKFIRQGERNAVKYADEIIVLSKGVQDYFQETYGRKTHFIPNGVNRPAIKNAEIITEKYGLTKDSYFLFLGRLVPEKGIRYLIEAFKDVKTDKKLVIAGGSSDTDSFMKELNELARDDERIIFTGFVQGRMLDELYSNAYIYTLPSDLEGMPLQSYVRLKCHTLSMDEPVALAAVDSFDEGDTLADRIGEKKQDILRRDSVDEVLKEEPGEVHEIVEKMLVSMNEEARFVIDNYLKYAPEDNWRELTMKACRQKNISESRTMDIIYRFRRRAKHELKDWEKNGRIGSE